jgi:hypothetical protein
MEMRMLITVVAVYLTTLVGFGKNAFDFDDPPIFLFASTIDATVAKIGHSESRYGKLEGYNIATPWLKLSREAANKLGSLLGHRIEAEVALYAKGDDSPIAFPLCFDPGYAVRLNTDKGARYFIICLHCSYVFVYDEKGRKLGMNPEGAFFDALVASYNEEFGAPELPNTHPNQSTDPTLSSGTPPAGQESRHP